MTASSTDRISIFLRDCVTRLPVGIYQHEQKAPQTVAIDVEAETTLTAHFDAGEKDIASTVSYEDLYHFIRDDLPKLGHIYLLESVAQAIVDFCFRDTRIVRVAVRIEKREVFDGAIPGVAMTRSRPTA